MAFFPLLMRYATFVTNCGVVLAVIPVCLCLDIMILTYEAAGLRRPWSHLCAKGTILILISSCFLGLVTTYISEQDCSDFLLPPHLTWSKALLLKLDCMIAPSRSGMSLRSSFLHVIREAGQAMLCIGLLIQSVISCAMHCLFITINIPPTCWCLTICLFILSEVWHRAAS